MLPDGFSGKDWREWRRLRALQLKERGWSLRAIADAFGVAEDTVGRGIARARARAGGRDALLARPGPGRSPRLTPRQRRLIPEFLWHGPEAYGFRGEVWTGARIAKVIEQEFGVSYHKGHVARLLKGRHWTPQVPIRRAIQREGAAIESGRSEVWPALLRRSRRERRVPVFVDESGFYLLPGVVKTYAPEGRTPELRAKLTRDPLSVMGGMTPAGKIYTPARQEPLNGPHTVEFLIHLGRVAGDRLWVIWDGSPIHRRAEVNEFVAETRRKGGVEILPGYAPDLNPWDEGGWDHLKHVEMRNLVCRDLEGLHEQLDLAVGRVRQKPHLVRAFFEQAGLSL
jgi:transposase